MKNNRLPDNDLTVLVETGANKMAQLAFNDVDAWESLTGSMKNHFREQVLPIIFAATNELKGLGYFKPYMIKGGELPKIENDGAIIESAHDGSMYTYVLAMDDENVSGWWNGPFRYIADDFFGETFSVISEGS